MTSRISEQELLHRIADLPRAIRPQRDPWAAISARMGQNRESRASLRWRRSRVAWAAAASVALALAAGLLLAPRWSGGPDAGDAVTVIAASGEAPGFGLPADFAASEAVYQAAFREFIPVGRARSKLSAKTLDTIEAGWAQLRNAESALAAALAADPANRFLNERMFELRARQLAFLQQLASLDQNTRRLMT